MSDSLVSALSHSLSSPLQLRSSHHQRLLLHITPSPSPSSSIKFSPFSRAQKAVVLATAWSGVDQASSVDEAEDSPTSIELVPISSEEQFDRIIAEAQQLEESLIVLWMANWCRKCIYLKPKLEKLAADYYPRVRFYCIDVNTVPQRLVNRAGITKMPTIQLWRDSEKEAEVIGGHKAWLVVDDVRRMIENEE